MSGLFNTISSFIPGTRNLFLSEEERFIREAERLEEMLDPTSDPNVKKIFEESQRIFEQSQQQPPMRPYSQSLFKVDPSPADAVIADQTQQIAKTQLLPSAVPDAPPIPQQASLPHLAMASHFAMVGTTVVSAAKNFFAFIPFFLMALYYSKEENLQNINVEITASNKEKVYEVGFGKTGRRFVKIAFEVNAGKPIRFLKEKHATATVRGYAPAIFSSEDFFSKIPLISAFIWKRQDYRTACVIRVKDPGNPLLRKGPILRVVPVSEREAFIVVHTDPTLPKISLEHQEHDAVYSAESSKYIRFRSASVEVSDPISPAEKHSRVVFSLPFSQNPARARDYYLEIKQYS